MKIVFVTGTRADYGKLKSLISICDNDVELETHVYITGMHLLKEHGFTCDDVIADGYKNIYTADNAIHNGRMDANLANTILSFSNYVRTINPDLIVVHGDRTDPLAAAIVGVLNNIRIAHIEGGEVTGTVDEFLRHAISKLSSLHFVANEESKYRLIQLGEREDTLHIIGSPDIDIMLSDNLPEIKDVKNRHFIGYDDYAIFIYHPVTTSSTLSKDINEVICALNQSGLNYIVIHPNNDHGAEHINDELNLLKGNFKFKMFKSLPFEDFIVLLKNSSFIIGNSSAGIREACIYGVPAIDIGTRQNKRYEINILKNIQHTIENSDAILQCIKSVDKHKHASVYFGEGRSAELFHAIIKNKKIINSDLQKVFIEMDVTAAAIQNYMNEVCF